MHIIYIHAFVYLKVCFFPAVQDPMLRIIDMDADNWTINTLANFLEDAPFKSYHKFSSSVDTKSLDLVVQRSLFL